MEKNMINKLIIIIIAITIIGTFGVFHRSIIQYAWESKVNFEQQQENEKLNDVNIVGTGSCTTREECEEMLGKGAFCSYEKCFPAPEDYVEGVAECMCPDGSKIRTTDCRWIDCPGEQTIPTEFMIENGLVSKTTLDINLPLSSKEAKKVAIAACGISAEISEPASPYENIVSECSPAWSFLDESNPCNNTQAFVCADKPIASCTIGGQSVGFSATTNGSFCVDSLLVTLKDYQDKFIVANPIDLSQTKKISKYRSCCGHDYSGYNDKGEPETQRSMKHYTKSVSGAELMNHYAPFDGIIIRYFVSPYPTPGHDTEHELWIAGDHSGKWFIMFGHVTLKEGLKVGSRVTAGEFVATSIVDDSDDGTEFALIKDISTETNKEQFVRGDPLNYMTDDVLSEYASYGLTPENVAYTKEYRDAHPCDWNAIGDNPDDYVTLNPK